MDTRCSPLTARSSDILIRSVTQFWIEKLPHLSGFPRKDLAREMVASNAGHFFLDRTLTVLVLLIRSEAKSRWKRSYNPIATQQTTRCLMEWHEQHARSFPTINAGCQELPHFSSFARGG